MIIQYCPGIFGVYIRPSNKHMSNYPVSAHCLTKISRLIKIINHKVTRCLARYSPRATTTGQPINRAPNEPAMVRNASFGPNLVVSGPKILFLQEKSKVLLPKIRKPT